MLLLFCGVVQLSYAKLNNLIRSETIVQETQFLLGWLGLSVLNLSKRDVQRD